VKRRHVRQAAERQQRTQRAKRLRRKLFHREPALRSRGLDQHREILALEGNESNRQVKTAAFAERLRQCRGFDSAHRGDHRELVLPAHELAHLARLEHGRRVAVGADDVPASGHGELLEAGRRHGSTSGGEKSLVHSA
jgi:hypothetical protein